MKDTTQESLKRLQLLEQVEKEVKQNTIGKNYDRLRKQFIDNDISSYALNLLIERLQAQQTNSSSNMLDATFFIHSEPPKSENEEKKPENEKKESVQPQPTKPTNPSPHSPNTFRIVSITLPIVVAVVLLFINFNRNRTVTIETQFGHWTGPVKDNAPNGNGFLRYYDKDEQNRAYYRGEMKKWVRDGKGSLHYKDSSYFDGTFSNDHLQTGVFYNATEDCYFEGTWVNDMLNDGREYKIVNNDTVILMEYRFGNQVDYNFYTSLTDSVY